MLQRTLLLAAVAAFTWALPQSDSPQCTVITAELQKAWENLDPQTFPRIPDFKYIHDDTSLPIDFKNVIFDGFSNVTCEYFNNIDNQTVLLTLKGSDLDFRPDPSKEQALLKGSYFSSRSASLLQIYDYAIGLSTLYDRFPSKPQSLCISNASLEITPNAERLVANNQMDVKLWRKLKKHTQLLEKAVRGYFSLFAEDLTRLHNEVHCTPQNSSPTQATRTPLVTSPNEPYGQVLGSGCCGISHSRLLFDCCRSQSQSQRNIDHHPETPARDCCQNFSRRPFVAL